MTQKDVFADGQLVKQDGFLVDRGDAKSEGGMGAGQRHRFTADFYHAFIWLINSGHRLDQCRFACAILTDKSCHLPGIKLEADTIQGFDTGKGLGQSSEGEERL